MRDRAAVGAGAGDAEVAGVERVAGEERVRRDGDDEARAGDGGAGGVDGDRLETSMVGPSGSAPRRARAGCSIVFRSAVTDVRICGQRAPRRRG